MLELESLAQHKLRSLLKGGVIEILGILDVCAHAYALSPFSVQNGWLT